MVMRGKYGHLRWEGVESPVPDAKAGKYQIPVRFKVFVVVAYSGAPVVCHLLIKGEVALQMDQALDDPGESVVTGMRRVCSLSNRPREMG